VGLGFGGARADGRPTDQVLQVLRGDRVEGFGGGRQAHFGQVQQQLAADVQAVLDLERVIQVRVVDQAFPADGGAWLLEIHAHDQVQGVGDFRGQHLQALGVFVGGLDVVDRAGPITTNRRWSVPSRMLRMTSRPLVTVRRPR
jgi:cobaltochelatase CobN